MIGWGIILLSTRVKHEYHYERDVLAAIINSECGVCDDFELYLVGSVVLNRCDSELYPNEIKEVVSQTNQFHGRHTQHYVATKRTKRVADDLLNGINRVPDIMYFCDHSSEEPMKTVLIFGKHHKYGI